MTLTIEDPLDFSTFYERFFPFKEFGRWLNYSGLSANGVKDPTSSDQVLARREFSFTLDNDIYIRFQSFDTVQEFKNEVLKLKPIKIDIGAVYNVKPKQKKMISASAFHPLEKELVFDIDMTDYDELRTCCQGGSVCKKCWRFMTVAIKVLDHVLRDDFGFKHLLWVYSGRRGVHCWVCDASARKLSNEARSALVKYLEVVRGGDNMERKVWNPPVLHPSLQRALESHLLPSILPILAEQKLLQPEFSNRILKLISDDSIKQKILKSWIQIDLQNLNELELVKEKWNVFQSNLQMSNKSVRTARIPSSDSSQLARDMIFQITYPRLDSNVSTHLNHLLKSPFCVHPKTGRVCVPIDPEICESFDPCSVPTINQLIDELNSSMEIDQELPDWAKTSLKPYVEYFKAFVNDLDQATRKKLRREQEISLDF